MKKHRLFITLLLTVIAVSSALAGDKIVVIGQNMENFYYSTDITGNTEYKREAKMAKVLNAYFPTNNSIPAADIYAFCEVECSNTMIQWIATCFSNKTGKNYQASTDDLSYDFTDPNYQGGVTKVGFVYDADKIELVGDNVSAAVDYDAYKERIRMQTFKVKASGECFTLSMNHFKAFGEEGDIEKRRNNATALLKGLDNAGDPDILIMGDLNSQMGEDCLNFLVSAGFEEQLIKYAGPTAWTHCFGGGDIIDHVFANKTMAQQVTNVFVGAANYCSVADEDDAFSDHNFYVVYLDLEAKPAATFSYKKATTFTPGVSYLIVAPINNGLEAAKYVALNKTFEYQQSVSVTEENGVITMPDAKTAFVFDLDATGTYLYMRDYYGRYHLQKGTYNSTNIDTKAWVDKNNCKFNVIVQGDGTFKITNTYNNYYYIGELYNKTTSQFTWRNYSTLNSSQHLPWLYEYDPSSTTGITEMPVYTQPTITRKVMENGRLIIVTADGTRYSVQGVQVKQ